MIILYLNDVMSDLIDKYLELCCGYSGLSGSIKMWLNFQQIDNTTL